MNDNETAKAQESINKASSREPKRYKAKSKTEFIPINIEETESKKPPVKAGNMSDNELESNNNVGVGMSIQERYLVF
jgi:hypothetical protein